MKRIRTVALAALFLGVAFAGCARDAEEPGTVTTPTTGGGAAPEAIVQTSTIAPAVGESVTFTATGVAAGDTIAWQFGDGSTGSGATATHAYEFPGDYIAHLSVTRGSATVTNEATLTYLTVSAAPDLSAGVESLDPVADASIDRQVIQKDGSVTVNASASYAWTDNPDFDDALGVTPDNLPVTRQPFGENITKYTFAWGDGSEATEGTDAEASHAFTKAGLFPVKVTVTDSSGRTGSAIVTVLALGTPPAVGGYKSKDLFVTAMISGPQSFDPGFDYETAGGHIIEQAYETLFTTDRDNTDRILPLLAAEVPTKANGGISEDNTVYTVKIRPGVKFHDGTALDAAAVKFSLDRMVLLNDPSSGAPVLADILKGGHDYRAANDNTQAARDAYLALNTVEVVDPMTVRIHLERPDAAVFQRLAFYATSIVSPTAFKACHEERNALWGVCETADGLPPAGSPGITRDPWADNNIVGTGPFTLRRWIPGDRAILDRNDAYWGEKPALKTVIVQYVDDLNTRIQMLRNGDADEIYVNPADINRVKPTIEDIARFTPADTLIIDAGFFNYDIKDPAECAKLPAGGTDCKFFQDDKIREAFTYAFDYQSFFDDIWQGRAKGLAGVIPRGMPGFDPSLPLPAQDLDKAKAAFEASAYKDGFELNVYYNTGNTVRQGAAQIIKDAMESLSPNIKMNVVGIQFNVLLDRTQNQEIPFWFLGWSPDYIATDDYIVPFLACGGNYPINQNFCDEEMDAMIKDAVAELDPQAQATKFREINAMAVAKNVDLWLDQRSQTHVERTYVQGYYYSPLHSGSPNTGDYAAISKA